MCMAATVAVMTSCGSQPAPERCYNKGINIIPVPTSLVEQEGVYTLTGSTTFYAPTEQAKTVAEFFAARLKQSTGFNLKVTDAEKSGAIKLLIDDSLDMNEEGYKLDVTTDGVTVVAKTAHGVFYGMETLMQLLPAEVESPTVVKNIAWTAQNVSIEDAPRFAYRGWMIDPCRHFMPVESIKKQIDVMALFKVNTMHWHLTEDQGWRIEIKKYPELTEIGSKRIEGDGTEHGGFYTQEEIKDIVAYAAERFITVIPELEIPGHELAAIATYPNLSCRGEAITPRIIWGVEDIVMCPGKEDMFEFLQNVVDEMVELFPSTYFHVGGDESPRHEWEKCPLCQARIKAEGLVPTHPGQSKEALLQTYVLKRMEAMLAKHGRKIIGWDEILEGGLSEDATVMSWRGEAGGIDAAMQNHDVIMTPGSGGMYLDWYQGDNKIEPVGIGGYKTLEDVYAYNPTPDTLVAMGKEHFVKGVQCNNWAEYFYNEDVREYRLFPRGIALAELAWSKLENKNFEDFARRINNAYVRLDGHNINYHIPQPEQPNGSCNFVAFIDKVDMEFKTTRPIKMVYTLDGTDPTPASTEYTAPIEITETTTLKIASVLPSGKMSPIRNITVEKQELAPAVEVADAQPGLAMKMVNGTFFHASELEGQTDWKELTIDKIEDIRAQVKTTESMRGIEQYSAIATGYVNIPEDGVYFFSSNNEEVWIDGKLLINNENEVKRFSRHDSSAALAKGLHAVKVVFIGNLYGGWPSLWDTGSISIRKSDAEKFAPIAADQWCH